MRRRNLAARARARQAPPICPAVERIILSSRLAVMRSGPVIAVAMLLVLAAPRLTLAAPAAPAAPVTRADAARAAIHPVASIHDQQAWLGRVPVTHAFPPDFADTLTSAASLNVIEMTTAPGCLPCADLWAKLTQFGARYHWRIRTISGEQALLRSGRLGIPWVGHPVAWVRPSNDSERTIPIAIGTDHLVNISRNAYLATKMLTGVSPGIALRGMAKFTGIVAPPAPSYGRDRRQ